MAPMIRWMVLASLVLSLWVFAPSAAAECDNLIDAHCMQRECLDSECKTLRWNYCLVYSSIDPVGCRNVPVTELEATA